MAKDSLADLDSAHIQKGTLSSHRVSNDVESSHVVVSEETTAAVIDSAAEKALCRKFDFRLLPVLAIMVSAHKCCTTLDLYAYEMSCLNTNHLSSTYSMLLTREILEMPRRQVYPKVSI